MSAPQLRSRASLRSLPLMWLAAVASALLYDTVWPCELVPGALAHEAPHIPPLPPRADPTEEAADFESGVVPVPRKEFRGLQIVAPAPCEAIPGNPYGPTPNTRPVPVLMHVTLGDLTGVQNSIVEVTVYSGNTVWQYDVPPTPYTRSSDISKHYLCPDLQSDWRVCAERHARFILAAQPPTVVATERPQIPMLQPLPAFIDFELMLTPNYYRITAELVSRDTAQRLYYPLAVAHFKLGDPLIPQRQVIAAAQIRAKERGAEDKVQAADVRIDRIAREYQPKHGRLFGGSLRDEWLNPELVAALKDGSPAALRSVVTTEAEGVYSFTMFSPVFCRLMVEELEHMQSYPHLNERPNSMNSYGAVLDDFGLRPLFDDVRRRVVAALAGILFPEWVYGGLDHHHAFAIKYKIGEDETLDYHMDESEVTLNVCLGKQFTGGNVFFNGQRDMPSERHQNFEFAHTPGTAILHIGQHWHGARRIQSGERYNVILWARSTAYHRSPLEQWVDRCEHDTFARSVGANQLPDPTVHTDL